MGQNRFRTIQIISGVIIILQPVIHDIYLHLTGLFRGEGMLVLIYHLGFLQHAFPVASRRLFLSDHANDYWPLPKKTPKVQSPDLLSGFFTLYVVLVNKVWKGAVIKHDLGLREVIHDPLVQVPVSVKVVNINLRRRKLKASSGPGVFTLTHILLPLLHKRKDLILRKRF